MDRSDYRSYVVRVWRTHAAAGDATVARIEWIAPGVEVQVGGAPADDLATLLEDVFDRLPPRDEVVAVPVTPGEASEVGG